MTARSVAVATFIALTTLAAATPGAAAQRYFPSPEVGVRGGYDTKLKGGLAGAFFSMPLDGRIEMVLSADFLPAAGLDSYRVSGDALYRFGDWGNLSAGAGLALIQASEPEDVAGSEGVRASISEIGYNIFVGYEFFRTDENAFRPLLDARWVTATDRNGFRFSAGLSYALELGGYGTHRVLPPPRVPGRR